MGMLNPLSMLGNVASLQHPPAGYTRLEYLEFTGTQRIEPQLSFQDFGFECDVYQERKHSAISLVAALPNVAFGVYYYPGLYVGGDENNNFNIQTPAESGKRYYIKFNSVDDNYYINDDLIKSGLVNSVNVPIPVLLGATQRSNNSESQPGGFDELKGKVFGWKGFTNHKLVSDLVPYLDENRKACFYDIIRRMTFYNAGTGEFIVGPPIV